MDHHPHPNPTASAPVARPASRVSRRAKQLATGLLVAALATVGATAWAKGRMDGHGPGVGMFSASPERVGRMVDHLLEGVSATDAQRSQVKQIAQEAARDLKAQHDAGRALREQGALLFVAPSVDAAAVESVRQQMLAQHDASSRRISQAMLDISKVLSPEQRLQLAQRMKQRGEHMRGHGPRGPQGPDAKPLS